MDLMGKEVLARDFRESEWFEENGMIILQEHRVVQDWRRLENRWLLIKDGKQYDYTFSHAVYSADEIVRLLRRAGFTAWEVFGDLKKSPYDNRASRLIRSTKSAAPPPARSQRCFVACTHPYRKRSIMPGVWT